MTVGRSIGGIRSDVIVREGFEMEMGLVRAGRRGVCGRACCVRTARANLEINPKTCP